MKKQEDLRKTFNSKKLTVLYWDVRNFDSIYDATKNVDYKFFMQLLLKQVPSCEFYPEAIK